MSEFSQVPTWVGKEVEIDGLGDGLAGDDENVHQDGPGLTERDQLSTPSPSETFHSTEVHSTEVIGGPPSTAGVNGSRQMPRPRTAVSSDESTQAGTLLAPRTQDDPNRLLIPVWLLMVVGFAIVGGLTLLALNSDRAGTSDDTAINEEPDREVADGEATIDGLANGDQSDVDLADDDEGGPDDDSGVDVGLDDSGLDIYRDEAAARSRRAYGVFASGQLRLLGTWPSQEAAEGIARRAAILVGQENVTIEADFEEVDAGESADAASAALFIDEPLEFTDQGGDVISPAADVMLQGAGALMALSPDARVTLIVPGLQAAGSGQDSSTTNRQINGLVETLEGVGVPADQISVEASAATTDASIAPYLMLSGGLFG